MIKNIVLSAALFVSATAASAFTITPISADCGMGPTPVGVTCSSSANPGNVNYGAGDGLYHELGLNGSATFQIAPDFTGPASAVEVTFVGANRFQEAADVFVSKDGILFEQVATLLNIADLSSALRVINFTFEGAFNFMRFTDVTASVFPNSASLYGFDLDSISVSQVPLPAGGLLLLGGLGGIAALRRKKKISGTAGLPA